MTTRVGKAYLVGAGPGDPELITVRGRRALARADVVLYDALVHLDALHVCKPSAQLVFAGKRAGRVSERQQDINERIVEDVKRGKIVVRLKGGDPFLFGRGPEEAEWLVREGLPFEVVPGVPSPIGATAYAGLSLTHRDLASSVAYITATESEEKDRSSHDWAKLATATQTLVLFMGVRKLQSLMSLLIEHGRSSDTPAAVVESGTLPTQRTVVGTVGTIAELARAQQIGRPALTIVGDVVSLRASLRWFDTMPLFGKRVLVMREPSQDRSAHTLLRDGGAEVIDAPTIRFMEPSSPSTRDAGLRSLATNDWVVVTSANAVRFAFERLDELGLDARAFGGTKVCSIGGATTAALRGRGLRADVEAADARSEGVVSALGTLANNARISVLRAEHGRPELLNGLRAHGADASVVPLFRTGGASDEARAVLARCLVDGRLTVDAALVTSGTMITNLVEALDALTSNRGKQALRGVDFFALGPVTRDAIAKLDLRVAATSSHASLDALVQTAEDYYRGTQP